MTPPVHHPREPLKSKSSPFCDPVGGILSICSAVTKYSLDHRTLVTFELGSSLVWPE